MTEHISLSELSDILSTIAQAIRDGSPEPIDHLAWGLHKRVDKPAKPKPVLPADVPAWGTKWSNNKSGDIYKVIGLSNLNSTREDFPPTVIYERESDNTTWSRTLTSFMLKFKPV